MIQALLDPDIAWRGNLLPVGRTQGGDFSFAVPQMAIDAAKSFMLPGDAARGVPYSDADVTQMALDVGMGGATSSAAFPSGGIGMASMPKNASRTATGWTFRDVTRKPHLSPAQNRYYSNADLTSGRSETLPIRSLNATQPDVNPDFKTTTSSEGLLPIVIRKDGQFYTMDGHHRISRLADEGEQNVRVRLLDMDNTETDAPLLDWSPDSAAKNKITQADRDLLDDLYRELAMNPATAAAPSMVNALMGQDQLNPKRWY